MPARTAELVSCFSAWPPKFFICLRLLLYGQIHAPKMGSHIKYVSILMCKFKFCPFFAKIYICEFVCTGQDAFVFCFLEEYVGIFFL